MSGKRTKAENKGVAVVMGPCYVKVGCAGVGVNRLSTSNTGNER
jgi:hypothetical protein